MSSLRGEVVATGIAFAEGPVWVPDAVPGAGSVIVTSVAAGSVMRVWPRSGDVELVADVGGGANGAALCRDGSVLVTQNGGFDFAATGLFDEPPTPRHAAPGLQLVSPNGSLTYLAEGGLRAPNDVAVAPDGSVCFTDPGPFPPPDPPVGRVMRLQPDGHLEAVAEGFWYCNGIAFEADGTLVVVERQGLQRIHADGTRSWWVETLGRGAGDGFCLDAEGRAYVASTVEHGIRIVEPDGTIADFIALDGEGLTTNCCFGGPDLRTLYVTDALPGALVAIEAMPTPGLALPLWSSRA